jgi:hypothetical protein
MKLDKFHYHEILDRISIIQSQIDDFVGNHPVVTRNKKYIKQINKAQKELGKVYQSVILKPLR